ncbi:MAG: NAD(+)/NADH kinase [Actinomycetales bacterium]|nr:NAD(+)/NADH kinase [Actinomycetales bacterium]
MTTPRAVVVTRTTEYAELLARHGTRGQAAFFLQTRGRALDEVATRHTAVEDACREVERATPADWRRAQVDRAELSRFVFGPDDVVVVVGPDGLVANLAKYLDGQPVIGINPDARANIGALVPHPVAAAGDLMRSVASGRGRIVERTMVAATVDDGQSLVALNEIFVGQPGHQSARYRLAVGGASERQSSSGLIVGTGTGATGWCASLARVQAPGLPLPGAAEPGLAWFVREAWPSPTTGADLVAGVLGPQERLDLRVESDSLVVFGDGIEADRLTVTWGQELSVCRAARVLRTVAG